MWEMKRTGDQRVWFCWQVPTEIHAILKLSLLLLLLQFKQNSTIFISCEFISLNIGIYQDIRFIKVRTFKKSNYYSKY